MYDCLINGFDFSEEEYQFIAKSEHKDEKEKKESDIPIRVVIGVTASLGDTF